MIAIAILLFTRGPEIDAFMHLDLWIWCLVTPKYLNLASHSAY